MSTKRPNYCTGNYYHIFNRSSKGEIIFGCPADFKVFIKTLSYYRFADKPVKYSLYKENPDKYTLSTTKLVDLITAKLMPTHFHFQLKQEVDNGIKDFIQRTTNSYAHYFNKKYNTRGSVFERNFKGVLMENDEQILHVSRYIHINSVEAGLTNKPEDYPYSSYNYYINENSENIFSVEPSIILDQFSSRQKYKEFVEEQIANQKKRQEFDKYLLDNNLPVYPI